MAKTRYLTISQAELDGGHSLWVVNTSTQSNAETFGDVLFNVPRRNGQGDPARVKVEMTWLPQDLNMQVPKDQILQSVEFRQAIQKQVLAIVSDEYAQSVLATSAAREERRRLEALQKHISRAANTVRTIADSGAEIYNTQELQAGRHHGIPVDGRQVLAGSTEHERFGVSEAFYEFAGRIKSMSDGQAMNELRARPIMKRSEMRCVLAHLGQDQVEARDHITGRIARLDAKKKAKAMRG